MTDWPSWLNSLFILLGVTKVDQKIVLLRVLKFKHVDISWPIRFVYLLIYFRAQIFFLLISFWYGFSRIFFFYVFSWLVEKYKNVTLMLMRFWSEISRMFLFCVFGVDYFKVKRFVFYTFIKKKTSSYFKKMCYPWKWLRGNKYTKIAIKLFELVLNVLLESFELSREAFWECRPPDFSIAIRMRNIYPKVT